MAIVQNCDCTKRIPEKTERVVSVIIKLMGRPGRLETPLVKSYLVRRGEPAPADSIPRSLTRAAHFHQMYRGRSH